MNHIIFSKLKGNSIFGFYGYGDGNHDYGGGGFVIYCSGEECNAPLYDFYNVVVNFTSNGDGQNIYHTFIFEEYE